MMKYRPEIVASAADATFDWSIGEGIKDFNTRMTGYWRSTCERKANGQP
jgi:hypothetical protein